MRIGEPEQRMIQTRINYDFNSLISKKNDNLKKFLYWEANEPPKEIGSDDFIFSSLNYREAIHRLSLLMFLNPNLIIKKITHEQRT